MWIKQSEAQTRGTADLFKSEEGCGNNRSVMPLDVPGCTRATMIVAVSILKVRAVKKYFFSEKYFFYCLTTYLLRK